MLAAPLTVSPDGHGVPRQLHVGEVEPSVSPREPRIAELVVLDGQRLVDQARVDVVGPQRAALVQVLVRIDDGAHRAQSN